MVESVSATQRIGRRYLLQEKLGQGGMGAVYRAHDRLTGQQVALKHVTAQKENLQFATRITDMDVVVALAQEFKMLASLRHPHIISVLDYGFDENLQPYYTMELLENAQDVIEAGSLLPQDEQIRLLIQVLQALAYLHRRGIIHRDLKPDNVLVVDGQVKVLDFGLAIAQEHLQASQEVLAGTLAYMAPELLEGRSASEASDLYAVGMIAYELFAERYPFEFKDVTKLVQDILLTMPDIAVLDLDPLLSSVLTRLLAKSPEDRFSDARELIRVYAEATDQKIRYETDTIRESFLQAARFVGRDAEMEILTRALHEAQQGRSSTWLIGGESGVGKSRLLEEVRTQALVQGVLAVRGEAISDGSTPYQMWQEPLRRLALEADLTDAEASILKLIVPDIHRLLERDIPDAPELDPQAAQDRLISTVESILRRLPSSVALFVEDLHWAGSESIAMLDRLSRLSDMGIMLVGSYRDDEASDLLRRLHLAHTLKLERLEAQSIQKLSESMLGEAGRRQEVVDLLQRETEGNVLFIIEVVRTLAEEAGQLELVGAASLPDDVFAGGMHNIIQRRLRRVPPTALPLLQYAAVIGRHIDLKLLRHLDPDMDASQWLSACGDAAVLEVQDDRWRFTHDKFREVLISNLPEAQRLRLHHQVAEAIEAVYRDNLTPFYAPLAHHWTQAEVPAKAIDFLEKAGVQALVTFANQEALEYFQKAQQVAQQAGAAVSMQQRARWERQIGQAYWGLGNLAALREHAETALKLYDRPIPASPSRLGVNLLRQVGIQTLHRLRTPAQVKHNQETMLEIVRVCKLLGNAYFFLNEANLTVYATLQQINLAERIPASPELAEAYANICLVAGLVPLHRLARTYEHRAMQVAQTLNDIYMLGQASSIISLYYLGLGQWETTHQYIQRAISSAEQIGDRRLWESVSGVLALATSYQGRFGQAHEIFRDVYLSSRRSGNTQTLLWGMLGQAENLLPGGHLDEAQAFLQEARSIPIHKFGRDSEIRTQALIALADFRQGSVEQALAAAELCLQLMTQAAPTASYLIQHYAAVTEIYLTLWEQGQPLQNFTPDHFQRAARRLGKTLRQFARTFPIGKPRAGLCLGWLHYLEGQPEKASKLWKEHLSIARELQMPYEEALLHFEIGRRAPVSDPEHADHLRLALALFQQLEAEYDVQRVQSVLQASTQS